MGQQMQIVLGARHHSQLFHSPIMQLRVNPFTALNNSVLCLLSPYNYNFLAAQRIIFVNPHTCVCLRVYVHTAWH